MRYGRIYDDIWTANIAGVPCQDMTRFIKKYLDARYPDGWEANTHMLLITTTPYIGQWHVDAPPYGHDVIALWCIAGIDEMDYDGKETDLLAGDLMLLPATKRHRGRCSNFRVTYHCRVGPKGKVMPESPLERLPRMTPLNILKRTYRTLRYYVRQGF